MKKTLLYGLAVIVTLALGSCAFAARISPDVAKLLEGLSKVASLYSKQAAVESDNFRKLLLTFARDIRVIIIMIVDRLALMRT